MLFNDKENSPIQQFVFPENFEENKADFILAMEETAEFVLKRTRI